MTAVAADPGTRGGVPWWLVLIEGIAALLIGAFLLAQPAATTLVLVQFLGWYWLIGGILSIVTIFIDSTRWGWKLVSGIIGILAGFVIIQSPLWSAILVPTTLVWVMGIFGIVIGVISLIQAFQGGGWGVGILGALSILFGLFLMFNPLAGALALPFTLGIFGIVGGIAAIIMAFRMR
jgi:uncharacterized membrane protein HdeD (DUF308 family)